MRKIIAAIAAALLLSSAPAFAFDYSSGSSDVGSSISGGSETSIQSLSFGNNGMAVVNAGMFTEGNTSATVDQFSGFNSAYTSDFHSTEGYSDIFTNGQGIGQVQVDGYSFGGADASGTNSHFGYDDFFGGGKG